MASSPDDYDPIFDEPPPSSPGPAPQPFRDRTAPSFGKGASPEPAAGATAEVDLNHWGVVGTRTYWGVPQGPTSSLRRVIRIVEGGVGYSAPTSIDQPRWSHSVASPQVFEMAWSPSVPPTEFFSLHDLGSRLRSQLRSGPLDPKEGNLAILDAAAVQLAELVQKLHIAGRGAGLLQPRGVMIDPSAGGRRLILPDLGFTWTGPADDPFRPGWLDPEGEFAPLWKPQTPRQRQDQASREHDTAADLRTLARLFSAVIGPDGRVPAEIAVGGDRRAQVWMTLSQAESGRIATAAELATALRPDRTPLSHHFLAPSTVHEPVGPRKPVGGMILGGTLAVAALGGGLYWATREDSKTAMQKGSISGPVDPWQPRPPVADPEWDAEIEKYRAVSDPSRRPEALIPLADLACGRPADRCGKFLELWKSALAGSPRFGAGDLVAQAKFYRFLRRTLQRVRECAAGRPAEATQEMERCEKLLPLS